jgi:hypothetical protein
VNKFKWVEVEYETAVKDVKYEIFKQIDCLGQKYALIQIKPYQYTERLRPYGMDEEALISYLEGEGYEVKMKQYTKKYNIGSKQFPLYKDMVDYNEFIITKKVEEISSEG